MQTTNGGGFRLAGIGLKNKTTNKHQQSMTDCGNLWQQFESEKLEQQIPGRIGTEVYAVYHDYEGDYRQPFSYFIGCRIAEDTVLPPGLDSLWIPEGKYLPVFAKGKLPDCIADAWTSIWAADYPRSYQVDYEVYGPESKNWTDGVVAIFLSVH